MGLGECGVVKYILSCREQGEGWDWVDVECEVGLSGCRVVSYRGQGEGWDLVGVEL